MRVMLATLCLNEMEWLPSLVEQHKNWPGLVEWVFVEAADRVYAEANPEMVRGGLSVDGTTEFLERGGFTHVMHGIASHRDPAQGKCAARNRYLEVADRVKPDIIVILDADEFWPRAQQIHFNSEVSRLHPSQILCPKQRHLWRPPSVGDQPLLKSEVVGAYWSMRHPRGFLWREGLRYTDDHNAPRGAGRQAFGAAQLVHTGFASSLRARQAKHRYYVARGEGVRDRRKMYVECREAYERWVPGAKLPHGASVVPYTGPVPEALCALSAC